MSDHVPAPTTLSPPSKLETVLTEIDHALVNQYWEEITPTILGPYMMDGFGLPITAGDFRFRAESRIVRRLLRGIDAESSVLDLGSGIGYWAEEFAHRYSRVIAVEGSNTLYQTLKERCGFTVRHVERNEPYVLMQMGCELIKKWQAFMPSHLQALQIAGPLAYWGMRLGNPWITRLPKALGLSFPVLENHYFVLAADTS